METVKYYNNLWQEAKNNYSGKYSYMNEILQDKHLIIRSSYIRFIHDEFTYTIGCHLSAIFNHCLHGTTFNG